MTDLNDFIYTDNVHDVLAVYVNRLLAATMRSEYQNVENLSATRQLTDADTPLQIFDCNGSNRIVKLPVADLEENHPFFIKNGTASGTYTLTLQNSGGTVNQAVLNPGEFAMVNPDGSGSYEVIGRPFSRILSPSQITANQNNYNPTGAGSADVLRLSTDASRDITGFAFPAGGKIILVHNVGSNNIVFKDESASSTAANRFALSADLTLAADQSALFWYDPTSSRWRVLGGGGTSTSVVLSSASPRVYTANDTWTKPAGLHHVIVEVVGGGGAGGGAEATGGTTYSAGAGGAGGGYSKKKILAASLSATETVTVGAAGAGSSGAAGGDGGTSSFGSHLQATGGKGGAVLAASATTAFGGTNGLEGGVGSSGDINVGGQAGMPAARNLGATSSGGTGGSSHLGGGGSGTTNATTGVGGVGRAYGGGGGGRANGVSQSAGAGAAGATGVVIVWEYVSA